MNLLKNYSVLLRENVVEGESPLLLTYFILQIPNIVISPNIDELQNYFAKVITTLIETHKGIIMWGQREFSREGQTQETEKSKFYIALYYFLNITSNTKINRFS